MTLLVFMLYILTFAIGCEFHFDDYAWLHKQIVSGLPVYIPDRPIPSFFLAGINNVYGLNPSAFKLLSVFGHCLTIDVLIRICGKIKLPTWGVLVFAVHPLCVSTVAYPIQFSVVLGCLFGALSFYAFLNKRYFLTILAWVLACFCKQSMYLFILVPILWWWFENKRTALLPVVGLGVGSLWAVLTTNLHAVGGKGFSPWERICTEGYVLVDAVRMVFVPVNLCLVHDYDLVTHPLWLVMWLVVGGCIMGYFRRGCFYVFGLAVLMASEWTLLGLDLFYEHRMYCLLAFSCLFVPKVRFRSWHLIPLVALIGLNLHYQYIWRSQQRMWERSVKVNPNDYRSHENLGKLIYRDEPLRALYHFREAKKNITTPYHEKYASDFNSMWEAYEQPIQNELRIFTEQLRGK